MWKWEEWFSLPLPFLSSFFSPFFPFLLSFIPPSRSHFPPLPLARPLSFPLALRWWLALQWEVLGYRLWHPHLLPSTQFSMYLEIRVPWMAYFEFKHESVLVPEDRQTGGQEWQDWGKVLEEGSQRDGGAEGRPLPWTSPGPPPDQPRPAPTAALAPGW